MIVRLKVDTTPVASPSRCRLQLRYAISCSGVTTRLPYIVLMLALVSIGSGSRPHAQTDRFVLPDDLEITLWAESPMFFNPTNIDIDVRGRVWVAEAVNYRDFNTAKQSPLTHQAGDRILILTDTNGDGRADQSKVFVQDKDLRAPLGVSGSVGIARGHPGPAALNC